MRTDLMVIGRQQGRRCARARNADEGDIVAAALALTMLVQLREAARESALTTGDLQLVINAFKDAASVEEVELPMGNTVYRRVGSM